MNNKSLSKFRTVVAFAGAGLVCATAYAQSAYNYRVPLEGNDQSIVEGRLTISPATHDFGTLVLGSTASVTTTLRNAGQDAVVLTDFELPAPFSQANSCPGTLVGGASCSVTVTYNPKAAGSNTAKLLVKTSDAAADVKFPVSGAAVVPTTNLALSSSSVDMGAADVGSPATNKTLTVTNEGNSPATVNGIGVTGSTEFNQSNSCGEKLAPGAKCTITIAFVPNAYGVRSGNLSVYEQASGTLYSVALTGSGNAAVMALSPASLSFGSAIANYSNTTAQATVSNTGNQPINGLSLAAAPADYSIAGKTCGTTLAPGASCSVTLKFAPTAAGARPGTLTAHTLNAGSAEVALGGTGIAQAPAVNASTAALTFGDIPVDGSSEVQQVTYTNTGNVTVNFTGVTFTAGSAHYAATTNCAATLAVGSSCTASVIFTPRASGSNPGNVRASFSSGALSTSLSGTGTLGAAAVSPTSLSFADQQVATTSAAKAVTVTNTGNRKLTFSSVGIAVGGSHFAQANDCAMVAPGSKCTVNVTVTPSAAGPLSGTLALTHDGVDGTTLVDLAGVGRSQSASLASPEFAATPVNSTSTATATLSNTGIGPLAVTVPTASSVTGAGYSFVSTSCGPSVAVGASCAVTVRFAPTSTASASGKLTIATGAGNQAADFGSTGIQGFATMSPSSLTFAAQQTGTTSSTKTVTVTNTGSDTLAFSGVGIASGSAHFAQSNNCLSIPVNGSCTASVTFTPSATGALSGTLAFTHNGGGVALVDLSGTGQAPSATLSSVSFGSVNAGATSTLTSTLTNTGIAAITVTAPTASSVAGTGFSFVSTTCGPSLAAGATCSTSVRFAPVTGGAHSGALAISTSAGLKSATLTGSGNHAVLTFTYEMGSTATPIPWGNKQVGGSYNSAWATLTNSGNAAATGLSVSPSTPWTLTNSDCTSSLAAGGSCRFLITFNPTAVQAYSGSVVANAAVSSVTNQITMTGNGVGQAGTLSTPSFAPTAVNSSSTATATLANTGVGPLSVTVPGAGSVTGTGYSFSSTTCGSSVGVNGSCTITVRFAPTSTAPASGSLSVATGAGTKTVTLGSTGIQGYASVSPGSLSFATRQTQTTSAVQTVTVTNTGTNTLTFSGIGIGEGAGDYGQTNDCGSVAVNGTCTINVAFTPSQAGSRPGTLALTHNGGGIALVSLSGTGQAPSGSLSTPTFPTTAVGSSSTAVATLTNTGLGTLGVTPPGAGSVTGAAYSFVSTTCGTSVPSGGSCATTLRFSPTSAAPATGNFALTDAAATRNVSLSATGVQGSAGLSPASLAFPNETVGVSSSTLSSTLTNNGTAPLVVSSVTVTAGGTDFTRSSTCVGTIAVGGSCAITVTFAPTAAGSRSGTVTVAHNGSGATSLALSGTGYAQAAISSKSFSPSTVTTGSASTFSWSTAGASSATVACSGTASGSASGTSGSLSVTTSGTGTGTCTVTARNALGTNTTESASLSVVAAPTASASFSPTSVMAGNASTFTWSTTGATSASVSCSAPATGSGSGLSGSLAVSTSAAGTGSCTVTAYNAAGTSVSRSASLTVTPAYSYAWATGAYSTPSACGSTTSTRSVWCQRSDGTTVVDSFCGGGKPATTQAATNYNSCTYSWNYGSWSTPNGCGNVTQTRTASCLRSDGTTVANSSCGTPVTSQTATNYNSCTYSFSYGAWSTPSGCGAVTQTRSASCVRSDGTTVTNSYCGTPTTTQQASDFRSCTYSANLGAWGSCSNSCGAGTQYRSVSCTRSDGQTVDNSACGSPATAQSCTGNTGCTPPPIRVTSCYCSMSGNGYDYGMYDCAAEGSSSAGNGYPAWSGRVDSGLTWSTWSDSDCSIELYNRRGW